MLLSYNYKMEQISETKNNLFKRQELVFETDSNLSFEEARKQVAEKVGKDESVIDVYNVQGGFGNQKFIVKARAYESKEEMDVMKNMELSKKKKKQIEEARVKAEEEANAPKEDAPAESSEETPKEEAKEEPAAEVSQEEEKSEAPASE